MTVSAGRAGHGSHRDQAGSHAAAGVVSPARTACHGERAANHAGRAATVPGDAGPGDATQQKWYDSQSLRKQHLDVCVVCVCVCVCVCVWGVLSFSLLFDRGKSDASAMLVLLLWSYTVLGACRTYPCPLSADSCAEAPAKKFPRYS